MTREEIQYEAQCIIQEYGSNDSAPYVEFVEKLASMELPEPPSNLDEAAEQYSERFQDEKDKLYAFHGFRHGAMWRDSQAQRLSNDIDRAAELSANDAMIKRQFPSVVYNTGLKCFDHSDLIKQFKAGAEWMAGQGVKLHGRILPGTRGNLYIESDWFDRGFGGLNYKFSDSNDVDMFVQIRKK